MENKDFLNRPVFNKELIEEAVKKYKEPSYAIGISTYNKSEFAYCLGRSSSDGVFEIILAKTIFDEQEFHREVKNLADYFDAYIFMEKDFPTRY